MTRATRTNEQEGDNVQISSLTLHVFVLFCLGNVCFVFHSGGKTNLSKTTRRQTHREASAATKSLQARPSKINIINSLTIYCLFCVVGAV